MAEKIGEYHKILNFTNNGDLGINIEVIKQIVKKAIDDTEGTSICNPHNIFARGPIDVKFDKKGNLLLNVSIKVDFGSNVVETTNKLQEKIERDLLYMTEIRAKKVDISVDDAGINQ